MKEIGKLIAAICGIAVLAYVIYVVFLKSGPVTKQKIPPTVVEVAQSAEAVWQLQIKATGTINAFQGIMVEPEVSGRITRIFMKSGQSIEAGQPLIEIFPDLVKAQLDRDQAALLLATVDYERAKSLYAKNAVSKQELDKETADLKQAQANVEYAQANLSQYTIVAPFSGRLGLKQVDLGDRVEPGTQIINLQALQPIRVDFDVPQVFLASLEIGQEVFIKSDAYNNETFIGKVYAVDSALNENTRSLGVRAQLPNKSEKLLPGMFVEATLQAGHPETVVTIPEAALNYAPNNNYVYVLKGDQVEKVNVKNGERRGDTVRITEGLTAGQTVVTAGQIKLNNGSYVVVANPDGKRLTPDEIKAEMKQVMVRQQKAAEENKKADKKESAIDQAVNAEMANQPTSTPQNDGTQSAASSVQSAN